MAGLAVEIRGRRHLDDLAEVHDRDGVGDVLHHREVVRDEEVREPEPLLQVLEQVHDAGLDRHVERGDGLVEHQERGVERERASDADALALTARELMRVPVRVMPVQPDERQELFDTRAVIAGHLVDDERFRDRGADRHAGIERRVRILEHDLHLASQARAACLCRGW